MPTDATSKSGTCLSTISVTACAKPGCLRPITLIGKSQGNASGEGSGTTGISGTPLCGDALPAPGAHDVRLEVLIEAIHPPEYGPRPAVAHRPAVEPHDGKDLLRRRGDPELVGGAHLVFRDVAQFERQAVGARQLDDHVVGNAGQDELVFRRRLDNAALDEEHVGSRGLGELAVAKENCLHGVRFGRELAQQHVADERDRFDVATQPPVILRRDGGGAALHLRGSRRHERIGHHEHRGLGVLRERVVALRHAARHLEVNRLVLERLAFDQAADVGAPLLARVWVADADGAETALEAREVLFQPERHLRISRHDLVDPIAEDEATVEDRDFRLREGHEYPVQENARYLIHSLSVSQARPMRPAGPTASSATSGYSATGLPSSVTRSVPTRSPCATGAISGCCETVSAFSLAASPLGTVT